MEYFGVPGVFNVDKSRALLVFSFEILDPQFSKASLLLPPEMKTL